MIISNYRQLDLPHLSSSLEPWLVEGCYCKVLKTDNGDDTVYVEITSGRYAGMSHWLPSEMVEYCDE